MMAAVKITAVIMLSIMFVIAVVAVLLYAFSKLGLGVILSAILTTAITTFGLICLSIYMDER